MKNMPPTLRHTLLAAICALPLWSVTSAVRSADLRTDHAVPMQDELRGGPDGAPARGRMGPPPGFGAGPGPETGSGPETGLGRGAPLFRGVALTEAQEDKIFAILHAEKPYLREQARAAGKAHAALRALANAEQYDDAKAVALAHAAATAGANIALQQVRTRQKLLAVLSPEQQKQQTEDGSGDRPRCPRP